MTDLNKTPGSRPPSTDSQAFNVKIIYILYLVSIAVGLTSIIGVIMAYIYKDNAPDWLRSHYRYQIRTFWMGFLYAVIAGLLTAVIIGFLLFLGIMVWLVVRCIKGMQCLERGEPVPDPETWWI